MVMINQFPRGPWPWKRFQLGHWPRGNSVFIECLGEYEAICETALGREAGPQVGLIDEKKTEDRKYRANVPLIKNIDFK
jgi:hypothetical protein